MKTNDDKKLGVIQRFKLSIDSLVKKILKFFSWILSLVWRLIEINVIGIVIISSGFFIQYIASWWQVNAIISPESYNSLINMGNAIFEGGAYFIVINSIMISREMEKAEQHRNEMNQLNSKLNDISRDTSAIKEAVYKQNESQNNLSVHPHQLY